MVIGQLAEMVGILEKEAGDEFVYGVARVIQELFRFCHGGGR